MVEVLYTSTNTPSASFINKSIDRDQFIDAFKCIHPLDMGMRHIYAICDIYIHMCIYTYIHICIDTYVPAHLDVDLLVPVHVEPPYKNPGDITRIPQLTLQCKALHICLGSRIHVSQR